MESSTGRYLGETLFEYADEVEDILQQLVHDAGLQARFFQIWSQGLGNRTNDGEKQKTSQTTGSSFKPAGMFGLVIPF